MTLLSDWFINISSFYWYILFINLSFLNHFTHLFIIILFTIINCHYIHWSTSYTHSPTRIKYHYNLQCPINMIFILHSFISLYLLIISIYLIISLLEWCTYSYISIVWRMDWLNNGMMVIMEIIYLTLTKCGCKGLIDVLHDCYF